ncbi:MAG: hypothetical protein KAJ14_06220, partial [Candidatus Omnitrophica bacterium]|nr:hypothetical protein [Candidatus Omnitrophota bacterium]
EDIFKTSSKKDSAKPAEDPELKELAANVNLLKETAVEMQLLPKIEEAMEILNAGIDAFDLNDYPEASKEFSKIAVKDSENINLEIIYVSAQFNLALSYLQADDKGAAEKELDNFMERVEKNNLFNESAQLSNAYVVAGEIKGRLKSEGVMNALIRPEARDNTIGKVVYVKGEGGIAVAQLKGRFDAENNNLVLTNVDSKDDREIVIPVKGEKGKQALENAVMFAEESMSVNNDLLTNESDIIKQINVFVGQKDITIYTLGLSLDSIMGFANREKEVFIAESLLNYGDREVQAIAVFNQVGEAYFAKREDELPEGVNSYIYMSGCGEDVREAVTEIVNISEIKEAQEFVDAINIHLPGERKLSVSETALIR